MERVVDIGGKGTGPKLRGLHYCCQPPPRALYSWTRDKSSLRFVCARLSSALNSEVSATKALSSVSTPPSYRRWARCEASRKEVTNNSCCVRISFTRRYWTSALETSL